MNRYLIITENDESKWNDKTGLHYHYPSRYRSLMLSGTRVIYYKGRITNAAFRDLRMDAAPHYFGCAILGEQSPDTESSKNDCYSQITHYTPFLKPIHIKAGSEYLENATKNNYWRDGVRIITKEIYDKIIASAKLDAQHVQNEPIVGVKKKEGEKKEVNTTIYERNPQLRTQAIDIHGTTCMACGFNFQEKYGDIGSGYIHVHHLNPLYIHGLQEVDPYSDLVVLCPNCHSMVHRKKKQVLPISTLKEIIEKQRQLVTYVVE